MQNRFVHMFALALVFVGALGPVHASAQETEEPRARAHLEITAGGAAFMLWSFSDSTPYAGLTAVPGLRLSYGLDEDAVHRVFVSLRYSGLAAVSAATNGSASESTGTVSPIEYLTVMGSVGYSVGFRDVPVRLGVELGYANVPYEDHFVSGMLIGLFIDVGIPFALG